METRKLMETPRAEPHEPSPAEVTAHQGGQPGSGLSCPVNYGFYSIVAPLYQGIKPFWLIRTALALRNWVCSHCPARMAGTLVAIHPFHGPALNATNYLSILLLVAAGLLGLSLSGALGRCMRFLSTAYKAHRPSGHR